MSIFKHFLVLTILCGSCLNHLECQENHLIEKEPKRKTCIPSVYIFDWGGVMTHSNYANLYKFLEKSFSLSPAEITKVLKDLKTNKYRQKEEIFWRKYASQKKIKLSEEWFSQLEKVKVSCIQPRKEMYDLVRRLKKDGKKVVVFSNIDEEKAKLLKKYGYYYIFDEVILSCEIGYYKPDPKAYDILLKKIRVPPSCCIFIDDREINIKAAKKKGITGITFKSFDDLQIQLDHILNK